MEDVLQRANDQGRRRGMRKLENSALLVVSCIVALAGAEVGLRVWSPIDPTETNVDPLIRYDPVLGWANRPRARTTFETSEFSYPVTINSQGMRNKEVEPKRVGELRVAVLGDSFVWGWGVADQERFTQVMEALQPSWNTLNFGVSGYGPVQYLLQLDNVLSFEPDFVLLTFSLGSDLIDIASPSGGCRPVPKDAIGGDITVFTSQFPERCRYVYDPRPGGFQLQSLRLIQEGIRKLLGSDENVRAKALNELLHRSKEALTADERVQVNRLFERTERILAAIRDRVDAALGAGRFAVLVAPSIYEYPEYSGPSDDFDHVHAAVIASLQRLLIPFFDGRSVIEPDDFWQVDGHWRPTAHIKTGELLAQSLLVPDTKGLTGKARSGAR